MFRYARMALSAVAFLLIAPMMNASDKDGHVLTALWKQYEDASRADRPVQEAEILTKIKTEAQAQRLPVDFYDAATKYVESVQRRDWKKREELRTQLGKEVQDFNYPLVTFLWMGSYANKSSDERWAFVKDRAKVFREGHNPALYRNVGGLMGGQLKEFMESDYEYALWRLLGDRSYLEPEKDEVCRALQEEVKGKYPGEGWLAYYFANRTSMREARKAALEAVAKKYAGNAVAFWPRQELLRIEFEELNERKAGSDDYQALYHKCLGFETQRSALKGNEALIAQGCTMVKNLNETLTSKNVSVRVVEGKAQVYFRNLDKATLTLLQGKKKLKTWSVTDPARSFYVQDTVKVDLPKLGDGSYTLEAVNGKISGMDWYYQHTLSIAVRRESKGYAAYVTDHISGKPLDKATLILWKGDTEVHRETVRLDGFTQLPDKFQQTIRKNKNTYYSVSAETGSGTSLRASRKLNVHSYSYEDTDDYRENGMRANIYKDRGAYNPGDTVKFKVVVYKGDLVDNVSVVPDRKLTVTLVDSEYNDIAELKLKTNAYGSVSGSFALPTGLRNGLFAIEVCDDKDDIELVEHHFRVDEFVLPTYDLTFDSNDQLYLKGDEVKISGTVKSYSGHALSSALLDVKVTRYGTVVLDRRISPAQDGKFSFTFPADEEGYYFTEVTVTDSTGEMQEYETGVYVADAINVTATVENKVEGEFVTIKEDESDVPVRYVRRRWYDGPSKNIVTGDVLKVGLTVNNGNGDKIECPVAYKLTAENGTVCREGTGKSGETVSIDLKGLKDGLYTFQADAEARKMKDNVKCLILKVSEGAEVLDAPVRRVFIPGSEDVPVGGRIRLTMGTADGAEWATVTIFGKNREVLETRKVVLKGERAKQGSLTTLEFDYPSTWPDAVRLQVFYFKRAEAITFDKEYSRTRTRLALPLSFDRFTDNAFPGTKYTFNLKTEPGVEALTAVYDKSIDAIAGNYWPVVALQEFHVPYVSISEACGGVSGEDADEDEFELEETVVVGYGTMRKSVNTALTGAVRGIAVSDDAAAPEGAVLYESVMDEAEVVPDVTIRSKFENALTFQPHLESDASGNLSFSFETSDKLSTYYVAVYAHDKDMRNAYVRKEMVVSIPVKVAVVEPQFLYEGDTYEVAASVSSVSDAPVSGMLYLYAYPSGEYEGVEPIAIQRVALTVPAGGTESHRFPVRVPAVETLGLKVVFVAEDFSDAVFLPVPVQKPVQTLTEAHSAVLLAGMDRETLLAELRARFINVPASEAALTETTLLDLVRAAIPSKVDPEGNDVLSLSEAYYVRLLAGRLGTVIPSEAKESDDLLSKILACRNADGGFGWFEGMNSSAIITATLLQRFAKLRDHGFEVPDLTSSVKFLDNNHFIVEMPYWRGYLTDAQYMYVRSLYASVPFEVKPTSEEGKKLMKEFQKNAKEYLVPSAKDGRGLQGAIMAKARRVQTLLNLSASSDGITLAGKWGVKLAAKSRMESSLKADIASLKEYAVEHRDGGWYYPNAVMPWRGLLETEADAHSLLCDLMQAYSPQISDGVRLWLMLQKETQKWDESPAFVDAITSILDGSEEVLSTAVLSYSATYDKPFEGIKAAGNGFTVERKFFREKTVERVYDDRTTDKNDFVTVREEIAPGTPVAVGDKIIAEYRIWNAENRSFVKVNAFREAALRPVEQLSGHTPWGWFNLRRLTFTPQGYRNVKADRTEYYFDSFPEENTTLSEEFFVTQAGTFTAPVITVESLYAPHYRANDAYHGVLAVE